MGNQGGKALKWLPAHFNFYIFKHSKIRKRAAKHFEGLAALSTHPAGRRAAVKAGCNPVHFSLDGCRCPATFPGVRPQLRDTLSTRRSVGRGTGAFIYAQSAVETRPVLAAPRHASTALFSCRFKCPCPPRRQRHFHGNADRAYNTLSTLLRKCVQWGRCPLKFLKKKAVRYYPSTGRIPPFLVIQPSGCIG